ncbi:uncharacterized protein EAF02_003224 [Botrytis sinoallii]|uniref:uncharacterized protein n=1 Tax=Botrytis sinoallii TaxID=1463999 RepID=UPI0018FF87AD|nr:uncharacterized protein EAF02_003224 [Botrytis sinoallii]KAF7888683.1 hypothetical protein EAF02_003224 [Botrytis sinoallii]
MPPSVAPLDKPSSPTSKKRPGSRRSSGNDKTDNSPTQLHSSSSPTSHGLRERRSSNSKAKDSMPDILTGAKAPSISSDVEMASDNEVQDIGSSSLQNSENEHTGEFRSPAPGRKLSLPPGTIPLYDPAEEVERLRAMNAQMQLNQHRERLAKQLEDREELQGKVTASGTGLKARVSPIHEEIISPSLEAAFASPIPSGMETASTESVRTIRGGETPAAVHARTPSYPFPPMRTPRQLSYNGHRPFTALSPTVNPENFAGGSFYDGPHDQVLSGPITPVSGLNFQPAGSQLSNRDSLFETPNLYDLSLMLSAEPGLDPWWSTVVKIMRDVYKADRVTLSVPADSTDIENVPWGQKATFNAAEEDELSLAYLPRGSSFIPSSSGDTLDTSASEGYASGDSPPGAIMTRPGLPSRHSFTSYEATKRDPACLPETARNLTARPPPLTRAKSYISTRPDQPPRTGTLQKAQLSLQALEDHMAFEAEKPTASWENVEQSNRDVQGRVFSVLQALDYEADPLIDSSGVLRVLEKERVIALTRDYPYLNNPADQEKGPETIIPILGSKADSPERLKKGKATEVGGQVSSIFGTKHNKRASRSFRLQSGEKGKNTQDAAAPPLPLPRYEEYEQTPPSPWSQSPAPSPAVRVETNDNPFFANSTVDEETFNPNQTPQDYSKMQQVEAIGVDRSWTVLHIPLTHPLLSKPVQSFRLDTAAMESKSAGRGKNVDQLPKYADSSKLQGSEPIKEKRAPIAILSILSPVIPYPSNLRHSLEHLSPHMATSFSLCRHYSNLETEVAGLSRKRPHTTGFGAIATGGRQLHDQSLATSGNMAYSPAEEGMRQQSGGSMTSPSDYSGVSRSANASPSGTPSWDPSSVGFTLDRKSSGDSPGYVSNEGYFSSRRPNVSRMDTGGSSVAGVRRSSKETSPAETRSVPRNQSDDRPWGPTAPSLDGGDNSTKTKPDAEGSPSSSNSSGPEIRNIRSSKETINETSDIREPSPPRQNTHDSPRRQAIRGASYGAGKSDRQHTQLHSYGADFGATFQSLPTTSASSIKAPNVPKPSRQGLSNASLPTDMPPPSDRLKGLMLDSLPAHVFVALPQTGEIVWVNSRYLTYRGQTVSELYQDPWSSIHPEEREEYLKAWSHAVKTGEQFSMQVRIKRFDGNYRWFYTRAVGSRDIRGVIVQWYGSHMDIHDQHIAEVKAARQEEIEASEAKHRQLANLIPQIIFAATEDEGVTFANEQWLSYTGQDFNDALGLGFMDYVHPEDLAKCQIPIGRPPTPSTRPKKPAEPRRNPSHTSSSGKSGQSSDPSEAPTEKTVKGIHQTLSRNNSSSSSSVYEFATADLSELARTGVIKVTTDGNGRLSYTTEVRLRSKTGEYRWHLVRCVEVDNINLGSGDGSWFGACTDINDHKLLETKLKEAMESKGKFLSNMSHEIRTPLIGISGMVSFLQDTTLNDEQLDYTNTIQSSASSLLNIINDILDLSKVDAGMMKLSYEWFHTRSLVEEVNEMVSTMAITKRLELNYIVDVDVPEMVKGDKFRIRQVLLNVIGNAIKFTTVGEVFTRCRVYTEDDTPPLVNEIMLEYSIVDTGRGFTKEEADLIFKPFSQIDGSSTRQHGGSGLGLVISRQLVQLHDGKMQGTAVPGKGSTFTFTAKFGLPTAEDHPEPLTTPQLSKVPSSSSTPNNITSQIAAKQASSNPLLVSRLSNSPAISMESPKTESSAGSPAVLSSNSSEPSSSSYSGRTRFTDRSSASSVNQSLAHFGEAARSSTPENMKLELPEKHSPSPSASSLIESAPSSTPANTASTLPKSHTTRLNNEFSHDLKHFRPPMYSILLICPQTHSREATRQHIEITLPKDVPHQITPLASVEEARSLISGDDSVNFTHIVLNLGSAEEIVQLIDQLIASVMLPQTSIVILSDPVQRQEVIKMAQSYDYDQMAKDNRLTFIYKPVKPSRFAVIFDPDKERDLSTDRNRSSAQQQVASQKQHYLDVGQRLGNKGLKILLVEDNLVNQKVLLKFLSKVGIAVELAMDGVECTEKVFCKPHGFYSLILCDLHMPRKDGYQTCREIREWESQRSTTKMPIIALSANVMADVLEKCVQAGFNSYVTKPVDFKELSKAMSSLLDPEAGDMGGALMKAPKKAS